MDNFKVPLYLLPENTFHLGVLGVSSRLGG